MRERRVLLKLFNQILTHPAVNEAVNGSEVVVAGRRCVVTGHDVM